MFICKMPLRIIVVFLMIALTYGQWPQTQYGHTTYQQYGQTTYQPYGQGQTSYQAYPRYQGEHCRNVCATLPQQSTSPLCVNDRGVLRQFSSQCELAMYNCETGQALVGRPGLCSLTVG